MEFNIAVDLDIKEFSGPGISFYEAGLTNCLLRKINGKLEVTQRPSINITEDGTNIVGLESRGRGIYYWEENEKLYIINNDSLYEETQDSTRIAENTGTFSAGYERCKIMETIGTPYLIIVDAENDKLWVMTASKTLDQVTTNIPATLAHGGAVLDTILFVMDEDGVIYNSEPDDPTDFRALSFKEAERDADKGVYLAKHEDHVVAFSTRTIEFFYNNSNTSGSVLNRRTDIMHNIGCVDGQAVWEHGDLVYFLGSTPTGEVGVYRLERFMPKAVSTDTLSTFLTQAITQEGARVRLSGIATMGRHILLLTVYILDSQTPSAIVPQLTISYDSATGIWGFMTTALNDHEHFPVMDFNNRSGGQNADSPALPGYGIMHNGDIFNVNDKLDPVDSLLASSVFESGVFESGVFEQTDGTGENVAIKMRLGFQDGGIPGEKFQNYFWLRMNDTEDSQTMTIKYADEHPGDIFTYTQEIDTAQQRKEVYAGGAFRRRNYQLEYSGNEQIFLQAVGADIEAGE